jgi:hypothetical protein
MQPKRSAAACICITTNVTRAAIKVVAKSIGAIAQLLNRGISDDAVQAGCIWVTYDMVKRILNTDHRANFL